MTASTLFSFFVAASGVSIGLLAAVVLWRLERRPPYSNQLLALLLFFLSFRVGKSVFHNFLELPVFVKNFGLACNLAVGPLLWMYGRSLADETFRFQKKHWPHFVLAIGYFIFCWAIPNDPNDPWWRASYILVFVQSFVYVYLGARLWQRQHKQSPPVENWYPYLLGGLSAMWLVYLLIFAGAIPVYIAGAFSFTLLMGILTYLAFSKKEAFIGLFPKKYEASNLDRKNSRAIMEKAEAFMEKDQLFLDAKLTLGTLAKRVGTSPKALSQAINENTGGNFSRFVNGYRVAFAQRLFLAPENQDEKVIAIAYRSGFNSLSSFNEVFKRLTSMTPTAFREKMGREVQP